MVILIIRRISLTRTKLVIVANVYLFLHSDTSPPLIFLAPCEVGVITVPIV